MSIKHSIQARRKHLRPSISGKRLVLLLVIGVSCVTSTGCSAWTGVNNYWRYNGYWNETMMGYRNRSSASKAWHCRKHHFCNQKYLREFAEGFKAGYADVADGGTGCTPSFPPREYWGWKYQSCEGQARVAAWFAGFPHGARAAEEEGIGNWTQIQTSAQVQHQYVQNGMLRSTHDGVYPIPQTAVPDGRPVDMTPVQITNSDFGYPVSTGVGPIEITNVPSIIQP